MKKKIRNFYIGLCIPLLLCAAYFAFAAKLTAEAGEYLTMDETIDRIEQSYGLYGSALAQRTFYFKERLHLRRKPAVAALGSSRVLEFRGESFSKPFVNLGSMSSLAEVEEMAYGALAQAPPGLLLLGVDFWWLHPANENVKPRRSPAENGMNLSDLVKPLGWLFTGKMALQDAGRILKGDVPDAGFSAVLRKDGFDRFGAYHYTSIWTGARQDEDRVFSATLDRVARGEGIFVRGDDVSPALLGRLSAMVEMLELKGVKVVLFLPPLAPAVVDAMEKSGGYGYVKKANAAVRDLARARHLPFFDFHDPRVAGANDCEFTDGIHGGQIVYDRILLHMAAGDGDVRGAVKLTDLGVEISKYAGHASMIAGEEDFLGIGCKKG